MDCLRDWSRAVVMRGPSECLEGTAVVKGMVMLNRKGMERVTASFRNNALEDGLLLGF